MPFTVVPALDITQGRLGVFTPDGPKRIDAFGGDPLTAAHAYIAAGARLLHIVDMDRAFGAPSDTSILAAVAAIPGVIAVQASGGVRSWADARALLNAGAARVVISSAVFLETTRRTSGSVYGSVSRARRAPGPPLGSSRSPK